MAMAYGDTYMVGNAEDDGNAMRAHYLLELRKFIAGYRNIPKKCMQSLVDEADFF